jgi:hypothetical protein
MSADPSSSNILHTLADSITGFPLVQTVQRILQFGKRLQVILSPTGIYEVLSYESTLELKDSDGKKAVFSKREKVRYLQNNVIAYQDQAWGDGQILLDYRSTPGKAVDMYRPGRKTVVLISIQNIRQFGDQDEFLIEWEMKNGFLRNRELWETSVDHATRRMRVNIIFPANRPPLRVELIEETRHTSTLISDENLSKLMDGRWMIHWETNKPRQYERYILQWDW